MGLTHLLLILHRVGFLFVRYQPTVFANSGSTAAMNERMSGEEFLNSWTACLSYLFNRFLIVISSYAMGLVMLLEEGLGLLWYNFL